MRRKHICTLTIYMETVAFNSSLSRLYAFDNLWPKTRRLLIYNHFVKRSPTDGQLLGSCPKVIESCFLTNTYKKLKMNSLLRLKV